MQNPNGQTAKKACIHIYCGDGKGKTTAAMGLCIREAGTGRNVLLHQFMKDNSSSERRILALIPNVTVLPGPDKIKFSFLMTPEERAEQLRINDANLQRLALAARDMDMLILDEAVYAVDLGLLSEAPLTAFLKDKPEQLEVVLTGRNPSPQLLALADYVSEIHKVKHPFDQGIPSRLGIEF